MFCSNFNRRQQLTVFVFAIANFCSAICVSLQAPFYPHEAERKGATPSQYGFVFGIFELTVFIVSPVIGKNLSRLGAKRVFNTGIFFTGLCSILFGLLDNIEDGTTFIGLSFVIRSIEAVGNSCFLTASFSIIAQEFPEKVATMFASMETCFGLGLIVGPSVGGALYQVGGYSLPFVTMGSCLIVASCLTYFVLPAHYNQRTCHERSDRGLMSVLKISTILLASFSVFSASVSLGFIQATLEPHMRQFNLSPLAMGGMFVVNGGFYAVTAPIWGWLCDKYADPHIITTIGAGFVAISFLFIGPAPFLPFVTNFVTCIISLIVHGVGFAAILVSGFSLAHREAVAQGLPDNLNTYALISSLWTATFALGAFIGPSMAGVLVDHFSFGWSTVFVFALEVVVFIVAFIFMTLTPPPTVRPEAKKRYNVEDESTPLISVARRDDDDDNDERRSPSIGYNSQSSTPAETSPKDGRRAQVTEVPRSRTIFSPFVSPMEGVSMMGMMGCSMPAASQTNSMIVEDENEIIVEHIATQAPARRGESATRRPRRSSQKSWQSSVSSRNDRQPSESSQKDESNRIQVTALVEGRRQLMAEESTIA